MVARARLHAALGVPSNLLAHHVKLLQQADVVERSRSEGDHRRTYLRLRPSALADLVPSGVVSAPREVFVCTHNSARSQLAAALWRRRSQVPATSAGTQPASRVHPRRSLPPVSTGFHSPAPAPLTSVRCCVRTTWWWRCATTRTRQRLHWSVRDPASVGTEAAFDRAFTDLADRVDRLALAVHSGASDD